MCDADSLSFAMSEKPSFMKFEKPARRQPVHRFAMALTVFISTVVVACIDSSMEVFTLEEAVSIVWESRLLIAEITVAAGVVLVILRRVVASMGNRERVVDAVDEAHTGASADHCAKTSKDTSKRTATSKRKPFNQQIKAEEVAIQAIGNVGKCEERYIGKMESDGGMTHSSRGACSSTEYAESDLADLFDDFDVALSAELQHQFSAVMDTLEAKPLDLFDEVAQFEELGHAMIDAQNLTQEAVNAFGTELVSGEEEREPTVPAPGDVGLDAALDRLEEEVRHRSGRGGRWNRRKPTQNALMIVCVAGALGLCGACADRLQSAEIYNSSVVEASIVFIFMPLGYVLFPRLGLLTSDSRL